MSEYISESTIDNPPKEEKEPKQNELFNDEEHEEAVKLLLCTNIPNRFKFKLTLVLQADDGYSNPNASTIPIAAGTCPSDRIEEILKAHFESDYTVQRIRAVVGMPFVKKQEELPLENKEGIPGGEDCKPFTKENVLGEPINEMTIESTLDYIGVGVEDELDDNNI